MGVIPMGEHYKSIFLSVIILADKFQFVEAKGFMIHCFGLFCLLITAQKVDILEESIMSASFLHIFMI